jgi:hypothetical protein
MEATRTPVFVSSVYDELIEYRKAAIDAIWRCDMFPVGMEREDIAKPYSAAESSFEMTKQGAVYVGIFSHHYGELTAKEL